MNIQRELNSVQILELINSLYPPNEDKHHFVNKALINVFLNGFTIYKAEKHADLPKATLAKRVKKVKAHIELIEHINSLR